MLTQLDEIRTSLNTLTAFATKYPINLPENLLSITCGSRAWIRVQASYAPDEAGREKILSYVGEAWGRDGWKAEFNQYANTYTWSKVLDNVHLTINGAEKNKQPEKFDVPPQKFPVMLQDSESPEFGAAEEEVL